MRDSSAPKLTLAAETFHVHSFVALFNYFSFLNAQFKILIECFSPN